jgi:ArsR family transcriptional regulator
MYLLQIYKCFCDQTRLRILHLLTSGPVCVCHLQDVLQLPQARISQHLSYLKDNGLVEAQREGNWMIYSLPVKASKELQLNLACLQDCVSTDRIFKQDLKKLKSALCCQPGPLAERTVSKL